MSGVNPLTVTGETEVIDEVHSVDPTRRYRIENEVLLVPPVQDKVAVTPVVVAANADGVPHAGSCCVVNHPLDENALEPPQHTVITMNS